MSSSENQNERLQRLEFEAKIFKEMWLESQSHLRACGSENAELVRVLTDVALSLNRYASDVSPEQLLAQINQQVLTALGKKLPENQRNALVGENNDAD